MKDFRDGRLDLNLVADSWLLVARAAQSSRRRTRTHCMFHSGFGAPADKTRDDCTVHVSTSVRTRGPFFWQMWKSHDDDCSYKIKNEIYFHYQPGQWIMSSALCSSSLLFMQYQMSEDVVTPLDYFYVTEDYAPMQIVACWRRQSNMPGWESLTAQSVQALMTDNVR